MFQKGIIRLQSYEKYRIYANILYFLPKKYKNPAQMSEIFCILYYFALPWNCISLPPNSQRKESICLLAVPRR